ncbi:MAG: hypothetical protein U0930_05705 [Pirellulales bacterium]
MFVRDLGSGKTGIVWWRFLGYVSVLVGGILVAKYGIGLLFDVEIDWLAVFPQLLGGLLLLLVAIEQQRSKIIYGNWRFRFSLSGMLGITLLAAIFIASVLHMIRASQREFEFSANVQAAIHSIMVGGQTYSQVRGGRFVVVVTRPSFSGDDLRKVIQAAKPDENSPCRIVSLSFWGTSVSEADLQHLNECKQLEVLTTSIGPLGPQTIEMLKGLRKLKSLIIDRKKFSDQQLDDLQMALKGVKIE